jgi:hypothetical protein
MIMTMQEAVEHEIAKSARALGQFFESLTEVRLADPLEPYLGPNGEIWEPINIGNDGLLSESPVPYQDLAGLTQVRRVCRYLARENPFAANAHENRISYIVGYGHTYTLASVDGETLDDKVRAKVKNIIDLFCRVNRWHARQQENVFRRDRDGEVFIRKFHHEDGILRIRYISPAAVVPPPGFESDSSWSYGIHTDPEDIETVLSYFVNGREVPAEEVQHRKRSPFECKRGVPILWPVRHNLNRALKILRNGSMVTEIQTAIGMIRKFAKASQATVQAWADRTSTTTTTSDGRTTLQQTYPPGSILNMGQAHDVEFPAMGIDPSKYVESLQAELRAVASRLCMPESMFTSKTDDTSRAAAFVAEGPAVKMFERLQYDEIEYDTELLDAALDFAVESGILSESDRRAVVVQASPPTVHVRDAESESRRRKADMDAGILSPQTASAEAGYDWEKEQGLREQAAERTGTPLTGDRPTDFLGDTGQGGGNSDIQPQQLPAEVADKGLNGAQVAALIEVLGSVSTGAVSKVAAKAIIQSAFPTLDPKKIDTMIAGAQKIEQKIE